MPVDLPFGRDIITPILIMLLRVIGRQAGVFLALEAGSFIDLFMSVFVGIFSLSRNYL